MIYPQMTQISADVKQIISDNRICYRVVKLAPMFYKTTYFYLR